MINKTVAYAVEDIVMKALIDLGMDFWWIDYQQGGTQGHFCICSQALSNNQLGSFNKNFRQAAAPAWRRTRRYGPISCVSPTRNGRARISAVLFSAAGAVLEPTATRYLALYFTLCLLFDVEQCLTCLATGRVQWRRGCTHVGKPRVPTVL
jgi:hypothetical protein